MVLAARQLMPHGRVGLGTKLVSRTTLYFVLSNLNCDRAKHYAFSITNNAYIFSSLTKIMTDIPSVYGILSPRTS